MLKTVRAGNAIVLHAIVSISHPPMRTCGTDRASDPDKKTAKANPNLILTDLNAKTHLSHIRIACKSLVNQ
jgi:hypothetical protein